VFEYWKRLTLADAGANQGNSRRMVQKMNSFRRNRIYSYAAVAVLASSSLCVGGAAAEQTAGPQARVVTAVRNDQLETLRGNVHPMARPANDRGALPDQRPVTKIRMLLQRSAAQEAALQQLMAQQLDPKSPKFHAWLTPQEFGQQFGPADSDVEAVKNWLSSQGFTDLKVNNGKTLIEFNGTAGAIRNAFHTEMHWLSVRGEDHFANMQEPKIPAALGPVVAGVVGLHNFHPKPLIRRLGKFRRDIKTGEITPLFTYTNVNTDTFYGVGPQDFATIYNVPNGLTAVAPATKYDGTGQTIAIVGQSNVNLQDITDYRHIFGLDLKYPANNVQVILNGPDPGLVSGDEGESDLDLELSGAVAPNASIIFVTTQSTDTDGSSGVDGSAAYIVDNNVAPILSESYGTCESGLGTSGNLFYAVLWQQAAAEGISVVVSAGDNGSAGCDPPISNPNETAATQGLGVSAIASTPYNVAMGGTDFNQANQQSTYWTACSGIPCGSTPPGTAKGYIPEMPWNDSCAGTGLTGCNSVTTTSASLNIVAGSGGPSSVYPKPSWQSGVTGVPSDGFRDIPDISLFSSDGGTPDSSGVPTVASFYIVCESDMDILGDTGCSLTKFVSSTACGENTTCLHDFQAVGGTSAAAPTFAGIMALINQKTGQRQGNANVELYSLAKGEAFATCDSGQGTSGSVSNTTCVFNDITGNKALNGNTPNLNNSVPCSGGSANCSKTSSGGFGVLTAGGVAAYSSGLGYDLATGLGSVNVTNLLNKWSTPGGLTSTSVTLSPGSISGAVGTAFTLSGKVTSGSGTPSGVVVFENASTGLPTGNDPQINIDANNLTSNPAALDANGAYSVSTPFLPAGSYNLKAHYGGDSTHAPNDSSAISVNLSKQATAVLASFVTATGSLVTSPQTVAYGSNYFLRVDVENAATGTPCQNASTGVVSFICPTGTVSLFDGGNALNDFPNAQTANATNMAKLNDRGFIEDQPIQLNVGTHTITASYSPDAGSSYTAPSPNTSNALTVVITQATTTTVLTPSGLTVASGGTLTLSAKVNTNSNSAQGPTGMVQFFSGSTSLGSATCTPTPADNVDTPSVAAFCTASFSATISSLPPGFDLRPRNSPLVILAWAATLLAILSFMRAVQPEVRRRQYTYAGVIFVLIAAAAIAGCGGGSSGGGGGGGGGSSRSLTAKYSGDTNYATSTSAAVTITVQ
jgi:subtilase family serine protease